MGIRQKLGERIKAAREERSVTQQVLADVLGINRAVISDWENGKTSPNLDRMDVLAAFLQKPMSYFFTEPTEMMGHRVQNPAFYVQAYSKTIKRLREMELELRRQAVGLKCLQKHFASQAALLLESLTPQEREAIEVASLDASIPDLAAWEDSQLAIEQTQEFDLEFVVRAGDARDGIASQAFATINAFPRIMDEVGGEEPTARWPLPGQLQAYLQKYGPKVTKDIIAEARGIAAGINAGRKKGASSEAALRRMEARALLELLEWVQACLQAEKHGEYAPSEIVPHFLASIREMAYNPAALGFVEEEAEEGLGFWVERFAEDFGNEISESDYRRLRALAVFIPALVEKLSSQALDF